MSSILNALGWRGTIGRGKYFLLGVLLFGLKYNLVDRYVARQLFQRPWEPWTYLMPIAWVGSPLDVPEDLEFALAMLSLSLPFAWFGSMFTLRRLRGAGLPLGLVVLFFLPAVNLVLFLLLCLVPSRSPTPVEMGVKKRFLDSWVPRGPLTAASTAVLLTGAVGALLVTLSTAMLETYGLAVFVALPFAQAIGACELYAYHERRTLWECMNVAVLSIWLTGLVIVLVAIEGILCVAMAAPLCIFAAILGAILAYSLQSQDDARGETTRILSLLLLAIPLLAGAEAVLPPTPEIFEVQTTIEIQGDPGAIWPAVIQFPPLEEPAEWLFRAGIAYPKSATISGVGVGAIRRCVFSTGAFVEPITTWDEPRRLAFDVVANPPPMVETSWYSEIDPAHLHGFFLARAGRFDLEPIGPGRTRLTGTTRYEHRIWPALYWRMISDWIVHRIHLRVLDHIRRQVEGSANKSPPFGP